MSGLRPSNPPTGALLGAVDDTTTTLIFPAGTYEAMDRPRQMWMTDQELVSITAVTGTSPETWTVVRGASGTVAVPHDTESSVERVYGLEEVIYQPAAVRFVTTGNGTTYVPDVSVKYHFIVLTQRQTGTWNIGAPIKTGGRLEPGDEIRLWFKQPATNMTTAQPTWNAVYDRIQTGGTTLRTVATTANSVTSFSFAWDGNGTAPGAVGSWHLIS